MFEARHVVKIQHYQPDNGCIANNTFIFHCAANQQLLTYCGVNAHFQNGQAKRAIRDIREQSQKILLHAIHHWPSCVDICLWPYAVCYATHL
ncbi:hypothetical protein ACHAXS_000676 [Conticribra weissflogii]